MLNSKPLVTTILPGTLNRNVELKKTQYFKSLNLTEFSISSFSTDPIIHSLLKTILLTPNCFLSLIISPSINRRISRQANGRGECRFENKLHNKLTGHTPPPIVDVAVRVPTSRRRALVWTMTDDRPHVSPRAKGRSASICAATHAASLEAFPPSGASPETGTPQSRRRRPATRSQSARLTNRRSVRNRTAVTSPNNLVKNQHNSEPKLAEQDLTPDVSPNIKRKSSQRRGTSVYQSRKSTAFLDVPDARGRSNSATEEEDEDSYRLRSFSFTSKGGYNCLVSTQERVLFWILYEVIFRLGKMLLQNKQWVVTMCFAKRCSCLKHLRLETWLFEIFGTDPDEIIFVLNTCGFHRLYRHRYTFQWFDLKTTTFLLYFVVHPSKILQ